MVRPTARGVALLAVAVGTYLAARVVGTWELYLLSFTFLAAVLVSWLLVLASGRKLRATRSLTPDQATAGDQLLLSFRVKNGSLSPGLQVTLPDAAGDLSVNRRQIEFESLGPRAERAFTVGPEAARRGVHHLPVLEARAEDPLGLVRTRRHLGEALDVVVYPRLVQLDSCVLFADMGARGQHGRRGPATVGASEFRGVRPHYPGEPLSHVDWKSTAKTGNLMMREMDDPTSGDITLLLDGTASRVTGVPPDTNFELAVQAVGSVADYALRAGRSVNLLLHETGWRQTRLSPDTDGHRRLLEALARATPHTTWQLGPSLRTLLADGGRLPRTRMVTLVVLSLDRELVRPLLALRQKGVHLSLIHAEAGSFAPTPPPRESPELLLSLASAGVLCLTLRRGDDLRSALSLRRAESRHARLR